MTDNHYAVLSGNAAMAMGGAAAGVKFYCAYPMSPSTGVLHWMAEHARKAGIMVRQVEDEIGVINMAIGAAHAGVRAMCATSGGGFALMSEGLGLSAQAEIPVVVIDCQRAGPSTGVPTKTEQGDLWQMLGAAFGDYPRVIAAPLDIGDCFTLIPEIFNIADRFQCPGHRALRSAAVRRPAQRRSRRSSTSTPIDRGETDHLATATAPRIVQALPDHRERRFAPRHPRRARPHPHGLERRAR